MVTPYQKERCIAYIREKRPEISYAKVCRVMGRSRTSKYYKKRMPEKDEKLREAITSILGTSRLGRKKVIVKVRKKYPGYGSSQIRRVYQKYGFSLYKRMNPNSAIEKKEYFSILISNCVAVEKNKR